MDNRNYDSAVELWLGKKKGVELGDLNSRLKFAESGEVLGSFTTDGRHNVLRYTLIGYSIMGARFGAYALIKATTNPGDQSLHVDVLPGQEYADRALVFGAFLLQPENTPRYSRHGAQLLMPIS